MIGFGLRSIGTFTIFFLGSIATAATSEPPNKISPDYQYGELVGRLIQAGIIKRELVGLHITGLKHQYGNSLDMAPTSLPSVAGRCANMPCARA